MLTNKSEGSLCSNNDNKITFNGLLELDLISFLRKMKLTWLKTTSYGITSFNNVYQETQRKRIQTSVLLNKIKKRIFK